MSTALALASVTAVLRQLLRDALVDHGVSSIVAGADVTAVAPALVAPGNSEPTGINVFCYGVSPNQGWRNADLPSRNGSGGRLTNPPLALDLHYLVTAYGTDDFHAEVLLGHAMHRLHQVPVLERDTIRAVIQDPGILSGHLAGSGLADQVEQVKLAPEVMGVEEISKLWTALAADYRPSAAYRASVVLVRGDEPARSALPVLTRGGRDPVTGAEEGVTVVSGLVAPWPTLDEVRPPGRRRVARLGEAVTLVGHHLDGTAHQVVLESPRFGERHVVAPDSVTADAVEVTLPAGAPADWPVGLWTVRVELDQDGEARRTNGLALVLAPTPDPASATVATAGSTTTIDLPVTPQVRPEQTASLVLGSREVPALDHPAPTALLSFELEDAEPGPQFVRLRVDGVESVLVDRSVTPPEFDSSQRVTV